MITEIVGPIGQGGYGIDKPAPKEQSDRDREPGRRRAPRPGVSERHHEGDGPGQPKQHPRLVGELEHRVQPRRRAFEDVLDVEKLGAVQQQHTHRADGGDCRTGAFPLTKDKGAGEEQPRSRSVADEREPATC